jgi:beta-galactosidase
MLKYKLTFENLYHLFGKYVGNWGKASVAFTFEGIKDGKVVKTVNRSPLYNPSIKVEVDSTDLVIEDTYDTTRVIVKCVDDDGNICDYSFANISLEIDGAEIIGPKEISFIGGSVGFWIKTTKTGTAKLTVDAHHLGKEEIELTVK